jgi:hypothetical protein
MQDLLKEDLFEIIQFYKTKVSEQELAYLVLQVNTNKKIKSLNDKIDSDLADHLSQIEKQESHSRYLLEMEKLSKEKEINNIIKKYEKIEKKLNTKTEKK